MTKGKLKTWWKEDGKTTVKAILAMMAIVSVSESIGYVKGCCRAERDIGAGLEKCFEYNPMLREELLEAIRELSHP